MVIHFLWMYLCVCMCEYACVWMCARVCVCVCEWERKTRTDAGVAAPLVAVLAGALVGAVGVGADLLAGVGAALALVHVAAVGAVLVDLVPGAAEALVGAVRVPAELLAGRRPHAALVHVRAHLARRLVPATAHAPETKPIQCSMHDRIFQVFSEMVYFLWFLKSLDTFSFLLFF